MLPFFKRSPVETKVPVMKSTDHSKYEAEIAQKRALEQKQQVVRETPIVRREAQNLGFLLQENNLSVRLRRAMQLRWADPHE